MNNAMAAASAVFLGALVATSGAAKAQTSALDAIIEQAAIESTETESEANVAVAEAAAAKAVADAEAAKAAEVRAAAEAKAAAAAEAEAARIAEAKAAAEAEAARAAEAEAAKAAEAQAAKAAEIAKAKAVEAKAAAEKADEAEAEIALKSEKPLKEETRSAGYSANPYAALISSYAKSHGVPEALAHAVVQIESNFRPDATGAAGEVGLMQLKLATARMMGFTGSRAALYDPETNIKYGMKYLAKARQLGGGTTCGTILKYNAGHGAKRMNPVSANYCNKVASLIS